MARPPSVTANGRKPVLFENTKDVQKAIERFEHEVKKIGADAALFHNPQQRREAESRRELLQNLKAYYIENRSNTVFISFSATGRTYATYAASRLADMGFSPVIGTGLVGVSTGKKGVRKIDERIFKDFAHRNSIRGRITDNILRSDGFLGIWTPDYDGRSREHNDWNGNPVKPAEGGLPSFWLPWEYGIAFGAHKSFNLLFERGVHKDYYEKAMGDLEGYFFDQSSYMDRIDEVLNELLTKIRTKPMR